MSNPTSPTDRHHQQPHYNGNNSNQKRQSRQDKFLSNIPDVPHPFNPSKPLLPSLLRNSPSSSSIHKQVLKLDTSDGLLRVSLMTFHNENMRNQRLVGSNNKRYEWEQYRTSEEDLKKMRKPLRKYYERLNNQIDRYLWVDQLLDSTLIPKLLSSYTQCNTVPEVPMTDSETEEDEDGNRSPSSGKSGSGSKSRNGEENGGRSPTLFRTPLRRRPSDVRKLVDEETPLLNESTWGEESEEKQGSTVKAAIYVNLAANTILLAGKVVVTLLTSSLSVLASLVDSCLDFLSTAIIWTTTYLMSRRDSHRYPIGRRKLEPIGVLVFAVIMITSFVQVGVEALQRLWSPEHELVKLGAAPIGIMSATVGIKAICWLWCRLIKSSSVQALAQDALTDVYFNTFSILFPLIGYATKQWWLDPLGGLLLSIFVIVQWSRTSLQHIDHLSGAAASEDDRNLVLYVCMRFAKSIKKVTGVQAYHSGDALNVEAEILFDEDLPLKDSHDVAEALQYTIEAIPFVDRAFVHSDYSRENPTTHLER